MTGFIFIFISLTNFSKDLHILLSNCVKIQTSTETLNLKILVIEQKIESCLTSTNDIVQFESYKPAFYLLGAFFIVGGIFLIHKTLSFEKINDLNLTFSNNAKNLNLDSLGNLKAIQNNSDLLRENHVKNIETLAQNTIKSIKTLDEKVEHLTKIPGVKDAVCNFTDSKTVRFATEGLPKVSLSSLKAERLKKLDPNFLEDLSTMI
jgi:hypothetical protein